MSFVAIRTAGGGTAPEGTAARIELLGPFRLIAEGQNIAEKLGRKNQALLAYLAAVPDHRASRERLASLLWGERFDEQARQSLRQTLMALRRSLADAAPGLLVVDRTEVRLDPGSFTTDIAAFDAAAATPDRALLQQAADLWRGDFLASLDIPSPDYEDWLRGLRETWRLRMVALLMQQARLLLQDGDGPAALLAVNRLVGLDPLNEAARRLELDIVARFRGRAAALQAYQQFAGLLQQELQVAPAAETQALVRRLGEGDDAAALLPDMPRTIDVLAETLPPRRRRWIAAAAVAVLALGAGMLLLRMPEPVAVVAPVPSSKPPFTIHVAAPAGDSAIFWDDLKTRVAMLPVTTLARERGLAAFAVEGSLQAAPEGQTINLRLIDNAAGQTLWAERILVQHADGQAAGEAATRLYAELLVALQQRLGPLPPLSPQMQAGWESFRGGVTRENVAAAQQLFGQALAADPEDAAAKLGLAHCMTINILNRWSRANPEEETRLALDYLEQAAARLPRHILLHYTVGLAHKARRDYPRALAAWQVALAIDPRDGATHAQIAHVNLLTGNVQGGMQQAELAIRLNPYSRALDRAYFYAGMARLLNGDYAQAEQHLARAAAINGQLPDVFAWRVAALAQLGRQAEAEAGYAELMRRFPTWNVDHHFLQAVDRSVMARFTSGIAKAMPAAQALK